MDLRRPRSVSPQLALSAVALALIVYAVCRAFIAGVLGLHALPPIPGGLPALTVILTVFSLSHGWYSLGGRLTALFFAISAVVSYALEEGGVATGLVYGGYHYTDYLGTKLGHVPVLIPLAWFMMIYPSYVIASLIVERRPAGTAAGRRALLAAAGASAIVMTVWDLVIDPILSGNLNDRPAWIWESGGAYFGVPVQNYVGWLVTTFIVYFAYRAVEQRSGAARRALGAIPWWAAGMPVLAYGCMLVGDLLSGVTPVGVVPIGLLAMGLPFALGMWRVAELRRDEREGSRGRSEDRSAGLQDPVATDSGLELVRD